MWLIQIGVASFWLFIATTLLFRESMFWRSVEDIPWFRRTFKDSTTRKWERFCRDAGIICMAVACLLFITLPFGVGLFGVMIGIPPLIFLL